jgi:hypothetical protein
VQPKGLAPLAARPTNDYQPLDLPSYPFVSFLLLINKSLPAIFSILKSCRKLASNSKA